MTQYSLSGIIGPKWSQVYLMLSTGFDAYNFNHMVRSVMFVLKGAL